MAELSQGCKQIIQVDEPRLAVCNTGRRADDQHRQ